MKAFQLLSVEKSFDVENDEYETEIDFSSKQVPPASCSTCVTSDDLQKCLKVKGGPDCEAEGCLPGATGDAACLDPVRATSQ